MIYGRAYEARTRECRNPRCGYLTNVHMICASCEAHICDECAYVVGGTPYCDRECHQAECGHTDTRYDPADDIGEGYNSFRPAWVCRDCGARIDEDGEPMRRPARSVSPPSSCHKTA